MKNLLRYNTLFAMHTNKPSCYLCGIYKPQYVIRKILFQEYLIQEELSLALAEEERLQIQQDQMLAEDNLKRQEETKRL
jgi:hypothetical protein